MLFSKKDSFEQWLALQIEQSKQKVADEARFSVQDDLNMRHTVMRLVHEQGRDLLQVVLNVYQKFKKGEDITKE